MFITKTVEQGSSFTCMFCVNTCVWRVYSAGFYMNTFYLKKVDIFFLEDWLEQFYCYCIRFLSRHTFSNICWLKTPSIANSRGGDIMSRRDSFRPAWG